MSNLSENIIKYRKLKNMTQRQLANALNVTVSTVANWERGSANLRVDTFVELCKILGVTPNEICEISSNPDYEIIIEQKEMLEKQKEDFQKRKEAQAKRIMAYAKMLIEESNKTEPPTIEEEK